MVRPGLFPMPDESNPLDYTLPALAIGVVLWLLILAVFSAVILGAVWVLK